jgi:serine/threonine protein phosphatase PrpC
MVDRDGEVLLTAFGRTDVGSVRKNNEDAFVIADLSSGEQAAQDSATRWRVGARGVLLAVSDGMGGAEAGEVASALVVESLRQHLGDSGDTGKIQHSMQRAVEAANRRVWEAAREPGQRGMGATLVAMLVYRQFAHVAAVGDSRVYLLRRGRIRQVTKDQSYVEMLVGAGLMTREQAEASPYRNVILQAMGQRPEVAVALGRLELRRGDVILLCSDGLSGKVTAEEMAGAVSGSAGFEQACERLIAMANARGGEDNITVVLAQVTGAGLGEPLEGETVTKTLQTVQDFDPARVGGGRAGSPPPPQAPATPGKAAPTMREGLPPVEAVTGAARPEPPRQAQPAPPVAATPPPSRPAPPPAPPTAAPAPPPRPSPPAAAPMPAAAAAPPAPVAAPAAAAPEAAPRPAAPPPPQPPRVPARRRRRGVLAWLGMLAPLVLLFLGILVAAAVYVAFQFETVEEFVEYIADIFD